VYIKNFLKAPSSQPLRKSGEIVTKGKRTAKQNLVVEPLRLAAFWKKAGEKIDEGLKELQSRIWL